MASLKAEKPVGPQSSEHVKKEPKKPIGSTPKAPASKPAPKKTEKRSRPKKKLKLLRQTLSSNYQNFMVKCRKQASSSGLTVAEKANTLMVRGYRWKSLCKVYHFSDSSAAFLRYERREIDFDALSRKFFIHTALLNLDLYKEAWQSLTDTWYKPPVYDWCKDLPPWRPSLPLPWASPVSAVAPEDPSVSTEPSSAPVEAMPISVAPSSAVTPASAQVVTMDVIDQLKSDIDAKFDKLYAFLASSLSPRDPPPS
ncbi:hypothetical protein Fmac_001452 [Flemingia macrophylla]|uniref:Uncharacterized protein n=1 Tax=Flemingia macrophylla TaxID=520843 RepID=A0ABD1NH51_9FABA